MDENDRMVPTCTSQPRPALRRRGTALLLLMAILLMLVHAVTACGSAKDGTSSTTGSVSSTGDAASPGPDAQQFTDVPATHPYFAEIGDLSSRGIITGFEDGSFRPDDPVTRQQFAKLIVKTLELPVTGAETCPFTDVPTQIGSDPFYPSKYVAVCAVEGITRGTGRTTFSPDDTLSRAQLITMVARAAALSDVPAGYTPSFADFSADHYPWARRAHYHGLLDGLEGIDDRGYAFWDDASRGEAAVLLYALLHRKQTP